MVVYMEITRDKYELPVVFSDNLTEFSKMVNASKETISSAICHANRVKYKRPRFIKVEIDETEEENE